MAEYSLEVIEKALLQTLGSCNLRSIHSISEKEKITVEVSNKEGTFAVQAELPTSSVNSAALTTLNSLTDIRQTVSDDFNRANKDSNFFEMFASKAFGSDMPDMPGPPYKFVSEDIFLVSIKSRSVRPDGSVVDDFSLTTIDHVLFLICGCGDTPYCSALISQAHKPSC